MLNPINDEMGGNSKKPFGQFIGWSYKAAKDLIVIIIELGPADMVVNGEKDHKIIKRHRARGVKTDLALGTLTQSFRGDHQITCVL